MAMAAVVVVDVVVVDVVVAVVMMRSGMVAAAAQDPVLDQEWALRSNRYMDDGAGDKDGY